MVGGGEVGEMGGVGERSHSILEKIYYFLFLCRQKRKYCKGR